MSIFWPFTLSYCSFCKGFLVFFQFSNLLTHPTETVNCKSGTVIFFRNCKLGNCKFHVARFKGQAFCEKSVSLEKRFKEKVYHRKSISPKKSLAGRAFGGKRVLQEQRFTSKAVCRKSVSWKSFLQENHLEGKSVG